MAFVDQAELRKAGVGSLDPGLGAARALYRGPVLDHAWLVVALCEGARTNVPFGSGLGRPGHGTCLRPCAVGPAGSLRRRGNALLGCRGIGTRNASKRIRARRLDDSTVGRPALTVGPRLARSQTWVLGLRRRIEAAQIVAVAGFGLLTTCQALTQVDRIDAPCLRDAHHAPGPLVRDDGVAALAAPSSVVVAASVAPLCVTITAMSPAVVPIAVGPVATIGPVSVVVAGAAVRAVVVMMRMPIAQVVAAPIPGSGEVAVAPAVVMAEHVVVCGVVDPHGAVGSDHPGPLVDVVNVAGPVDGAFGESPRRRSLPPRPVPSQSASTTSMDVTTSDASTASPATVSAGSTATCRTVADTVGTTPGRGSRIATSRLRSTAPVKSTTHAVSVSESS